VWNTTAQGMVEFRGEVERGARATGVAVNFVDVRQPEDYLPALLDHARPDALFIAWDPVVGAVAPRLVDYARNHRLPTISAIRAFVEMGGLMSLSPDPAELVAAVARYVDRILRGASPATLPVEQPTRYHLIVNRKAADAIGLPLPHTLLLQATEVVER
jgi:putative ABC transport system substrate-binding protein